MEEPNLEVKLLAIVNLLNAVNVSGEENMTRLVTAMRELRTIANQLHNNPNMQE